MTELQAGSAPSTRISDKQISQQIHDELARKLALTQTQAETRKDIEAKQAILPLDAPTAVAGKETAGNHSEQRRNLRAFISRPIGLFIGDEQTGSLKLGEQQARAKALLANQARDAGVNPELALEHTLIKLNDGNIQQANRQIVAEIEQTERAVQETRRKAQTAAVPHDTTEIGSAVDTMYTAVAQPIVIGTDQRANNHQIIGSEQGSGTAIKSQTQQALSQPSAGGTLQQQTGQQQTGQQQTEDGADHRNGAQRNESGFYPAPPPPSSSHSILTTESPIENSKSTSHLEQIDPEENWLVEFPESTLQNYETSADPERIYFDHVLPERRALKAVELPDLIVDLPLNEKKLPLKED